MKKSKKLLKLLVSTTIVTMSLTVSLGIVGSPINSTETPSTVYAEESFNPNGYGLKTDTGWVTSRIICSEDFSYGKYSLEELSKLSVAVNPVDNPKYFTPEGKGDTMNLSPDNLYLTDNIYHYSYTYKGSTYDDFIKICYVRSPRTTGLHVLKGWATCQYKDGKYVAGKNESGQTDIDKDLRLTEKSEYIKTLNNEAIKSERLVRLSGSDRFETATKIADEYLEESGMTKFHKLYVADGFNYPDALSASTLVSLDSSSILLASSLNNESNKTTLEYIKNNLASNGEVVILGGTTAVTPAFESSVKAMGFKTSRISGKDRYETNRNINNILSATYGVTGDNAFVASGLSYADALSVSGIAAAKRMPVVLANVNPSPEFVDSITQNAVVYIVGGTSAVSQAVEDAVNTKATSCTRIQGENRYETSRRVLTTFNYSLLATSSTACFASGTDFPDALTGSSIAGLYNSTVLLVDKNDYKDQTDLVHNKGIKNNYIFGGNSAVSAVVETELAK